MIFDDVQAAEKFYKEYAHDAGFSIRIGQQRIDDSGVLKWKRFLCARAGYKTSLGTNSNDSSKEVRRTRETRCGCEAYIYVKRTSEGKYEIAALNKGHNHAFVTHICFDPTVSEKAKTTLFNCHKVSIGTSQAYRLLKVGAWGFEYVDCTKKDLQNYYSDFRHKIKDADAQMFINNLYALQELDHNFFFEYEVMDGRLFRVFWANTTSKKNYAHFGDVLFFDTTYSTN
jgi:hypothetical protein